MFESSLIDLGDKAKRVQTRRWLSLPVAVGIHLVLAASVAFAAYWNIAAVPEPSVNVVFFAQQEPPQVSSAPAPGPEPAAPTPAQVPVVKPEQPVQPEVVPDVVPVADPTPVPVVTFAGPVDSQSTDPSGGSGGGGGAGRGGADGGVCIGDQCGDDPSSLVPVGAPVTSAVPLAVGGAVIAPEAVYRVQPVYPEAARRARLAGAVIVQAIIDEQGRVTGVELVKGMPLGIDRAVIEAVRQWRFKPATLHGRPVKVYYSLTVRFEVR